ncbi:HAD family hydrolase [Roseospira goensis]|uniref:HAD superfamily hydrolase (TIGR01509 family) n=1 Tax=Roseospira goensis TaxID=391922 RepID=A0A7W6RZ41_9PROT|nr:HAD family phosphatase [Roseospira goensis]MBB4285904.1 HAD superfamily hydrolase (TIGR01509 family) [Roseospira goensis]
MTAFDSPPKAVAWDVDGTLVDSEPLHHRALLSAGVCFGADLSDLPDQAFRGVHMDDVWVTLRDRFPASLDKAAWLEHIGAFYVTHSAEVIPVPGAVEAVRRLHALGIPQACVSNSERRVVDANLAALGVLDRIAFSIALDDVTAGKPSPEPYQRAAARLGIPPADIVAVEDSNTGLASAASAGLRTVGLQHPGEAALHAAVIVATPVRILDFFERTPAA